MGDCHRIFVIDEFNWGYTNFKRKTVIDQVKSLYPSAELETDIPYMMIFDIDKDYLGSFMDGKIVCDAIKYQSDVERYNIHDLKKRYKGVENKDGVILYP